MQSLSYGHCNSSSLNWCTLEERRSRDDMIEVFKLLNGFEVVVPNTRLRDLLLVLEGMSLNYIKVVSAQIWDWYSFPQHVVSSNTVNTL